MSLELEIIVKLAVLVVGFTYLLVLMRKPVPIPWSKRLLWGIALLGGVSYFNFGKYHTDGSFLHNWEQYHYVLNSKYYAELGHDGLYAAGLLAAMERDPAYTPPQKVRDLRTEKIVPLETVKDHINEVRARFSDDRWQQFMTDSGGLYVREDIWRDHGYNPTPAWTFVGQSVTRWFVWRHLTAKLYAMIDVLLLGGLFLVFYLYFGLETACLTAFLFGLNYCSRYFWNGGAFIRQDWFLATGIALGALSKRQYVASGLALSYAVAVRLFPVFFALPLVVYAASCLRRKQTIRWAVRMALGFVVGLAVMVGLGCLTGRGCSAWPEALAKLSKHREMVAALNNVGLEPLFTTSIANFVGDLTNPKTFYDYAAIRDDTMRLIEARKSIIIFAKAIFTALLLWLTWRQKNPVRAFLLGIAFIYVLAAPRCYYWSMLVFIPLLSIDDPKTFRRLAAMVVTANLAIYLWHPIYFVLIKIGVLTRMSVSGVYWPVSVIVGLLLIVVFGYSERRGF